MRVNARRWRCQPIARRRQTCFLPISLDSRINWGNAFWFNFIPVTIGSIVGAWFLVIPFWFVNKDGFWKRQEREAAAKAAKEEKVVEA